MAYRPTAEAFCSARRQTLDKHCLSATGAEVAEPAQRATGLAQRRGLQTAIEADLGAISPGRAAAGGGHGQLAEFEGERAF